LTGKLLAYLSVFLVIVTSISDELNWPMADQSICSGE